MSGYFCLLLISEEKLSFITKFISWGIFIDWKNSSLRLRKVPYIPSLGFYHEWVLWHSMCSFLETVPCELEKNVCSAVVVGLHMSGQVGWWHSLFCFLSSCSINYWECDINLQISLLNCPLLLQLCHFFLHVFVFRCIYINSCYIWNQAGPCSPLPGTDPHVPHPFFVEKL